MTVPVRYVSKRVAPYEQPAILYRAAEKFLQITVVSPRTGNRFGLRVVDACGEIRVEGPSFSWPAAKAMLKSSPMDNMYALVLMQQRINNWYMTGSAE